MSTRTLWKDLADQLKIGFLGKVFLGFLSVVGVVLTLIMFIMVFLKEADCKDEYGRLVVARSK